jgi:hypothetical protein
VGIDQEYGARIGGPAAAGASRPKAPTPRAGGACLPGVQPGRRGTRWTKRP